MSYGAELINLVMKYLLSVCDEEVIGVEGKENTLGSALSIINILVASWEDRTKFVQEGRCCPFVSKLATCSQVIVLRRCSDNATELITV